MRFRQLDEITELTPGVSIRAVRQLRAEEDYLEDHFPGFPVMPGVLMLEALYQAGMWLVLATEKFSCSLVTLQSARNVKYADFVAPGQTLSVACDWLKRDGALTTLKAQGMVHGPNKEPSSAVSARLVLEHSSLAERYPERSRSDPLMRRELRTRFDALFSAAAELMK